MVDGICIVDDKLNSNKYDNERSSSTYMLLCSILVSTLFYDADYILITWQIHSFDRRCVDYGEYVGVAASISYCIICLRLLFIADAFNEYRPSIEKTFVDFFVHTTV